MAQTVKASAYNAVDLGSIPGLGRSPGEGNGSPLQYCCLENPMDRGAWQAAVHGVAKSQIQLRDQHFGIWRRKIRGHKMSFHHIISKVHTINLTNHY